MALNNISLAALNYQGVDLPVGGDGVFASLTFDPRYTATKSIGGNVVYNKMKGRMGVITITCLPTDPCNVLLRGLVNADEAAQGLVRGAGSAIDGGTGQNIVWANGRITQEGDFIISEEVQTVSWTITINEFEIVQLIGLGSLS